MKSKLPLIALCGTAGALAGMVALGTATAGQGIAVATLSLPDAFPYEAALASTQPAAPPAVPAQRSAQVVSVIPQVVTVPTDPGLLVQTAASSDLSPRPAAPAASSAAPAQLAQGGPPPEMRPDAPRPEPGARAEADGRPFPPPGFPPPGFPPPGFPPPRPNPMQVASLLAAQEVALGIRADQIDVWRAFASAVVDFVKAEGPPPAPPKKDEPFALPQAIATRALDAGARAKAVLDTRTALIAKLTPAQVERARTLDMPPPPPPFGAGPHMDGPPPFAPPRP